MTSHGLLSSKHLGLLMANLVAVLGETTITTGVARIIVYIKERIKIQLEGVNLHDIELREDWNIMWKVATLQWQQLGKM